jgi:hypothetical protein
MWGKSDQHRHRRRRHSHRQLRLIILLVGGLSLITGLVLSVWSALESNTMMRFFGLVYLAIGGSLLSVYFVLSLVHRLSKDVRQEGSRGSSNGRDGFALLMALLLAALLSGVVLHSLVNASMAVRHGDRLRTRALLRLAASDAAWSAVATLAQERASAGGQGDAQRRERILPNDVKTSVSVRRIDRATLPPALMPPKAPVFGDFFQISSLATDGKTSFELRSFACRVPSRETRILGWVER